MARADALASERFSSIARSDSNWPLWKPANSMSGFAEVALAASEAVPTDASPAAGVAMVFSCFVEPCFGDSSVFGSGLRADRAMGFLSLWNGATRPRWRCSWFCQSCSAAYNFLGKLCLSGQESLVTQLANNRRDPLTV